MMVDSELTNDKRAEIAEFDRNNLSHLLPLGYFHFEHEDGDFFISRSDVRQIELRNNGNAVIRFKDDSRATIILHRVPAESRAAIKRDLVLMSRLLLYCESPSGGA